MPRSKMDFLNYAKQNSKPIDQPIIPGNRFETNGVGFNGGDEVVGDYVWRTDADNGYANETSTRYQQQGPSESLGDVGNGETETISAYSDDRGMDGSNQSSGGTSYPTSDNYIEIGESDSSSYKPIESISGSTSRKSVVRKRTTLVDRAAQFIGISDTNKKKIQPLKAVVSTRKVLTIAEISKYRPILIKMMLLTSEHLDHIITATTKNHTEVIIWSDLEYTDAEILVDTFQKAGQQSSWVADKVRLIITYHSKLQAGIILAPRMWKTIMYMFTTGLDIRIF